MSENSSRQHNCFPPSYRWRTRKDFSFLSRSGRRFSTEHISVSWGFSSRNHARIGLTVSRRFGPAVDRNLFRRRAKEAFRTSSVCEIPGLEIHIRPSGQGKASWNEFVDLFKQLHTAVGTKQ